jgi:hypothetical protein
MIYIYKPKLYTLIMLLVVLYIYTGSCKCFRACKCKCAYYILLVNIPTCNPYWLVASASQSSMFVLSEKPFCLTLQKKFMIF